MNKNLCFDDETGHWSSERKSVTYEGCNLLPICGQGREMQKNKS